MTNERYKLTEESKMFEGVEVFRIKALMDFADVKVGDLGGFISSKDDLCITQDDESWVYDDSIVYKSQGVSSNSKVLNSSIVENSTVSRGSIIDNSQISESVIENSSIEGSLVREDSKIYNSPCVEISDIVSSSLNSMDDVSGSTVDGTQAQESAIVDSNVIDSFLNGVGVHENSNVNCSDVRLSSIRDSSSVTDSVLRSSTSRGSGESDTHTKVSKTSEVARSSIYSSVIIGTICYNSHIEYVTKIDGHLENYDSRKITQLTDEDFMALEEEGFGLQQEMRGYEKSVIGLIMLG